MKQVSENSWAEDAESMLTPLLADLTTRFCSGNRWMLRQSYVNICNQLVTDRALPLEEFAKLLLAPLLALKQDRVPNVRLVLARVINFQLKYHGRSFRSLSHFRFSTNCETFLLSTQSFSLDRIVPTGNRWTKRSTSCRPMRIVMSRITPQSNGNKRRSLRIRSSRWARTPRDSQLELKQTWKMHTITHTHTLSCMMPIQSHIKICTSCVPLSPLLLSGKKKSSISSFLKPNELKARVPSVCVFVVCALYKQHDTCVRNLDGKRGK